jgi:hypothetical protein
MTADEIINYKTTKQIKVYKLNQIGLSNAEIVEAIKPLFVGTAGSRNESFVRWVLNEFAENPKKIERANKIRD